ncbi:type II toxin-antitoxin system RelE/ParE family toxin [Sphingomonas sp. YR710]|uniref:type II toxin-antitoxin system RelE/ParE family toxin n=1 Tax=Sphingomonas sp. YR710 TaxID=1882773 RepID=UPI0015A291A8|nr:type II toxin-antitoxin system RelE/ParE family toxin [Sphingomonas sp. YR710]
MKVRLTSEAWHDILAIGDHIAMDNPVRARTFMRELRSKAHDLADMPYAFPLVPRFERYGIRRRAHGPYLIFYIVEEANVAVLRILHAPAIMGDC